MDEGPRPKQADIARRAAPGIAPNPGAETPGRSPEGVGACRDLYRSTIQKAEDTGSHRL
jgi:hypothetical protein